MEKGRTRRVEGGEVWYQYRWPGAQSYLLTRTGMQKLHLDASPRVECHTVLQVGRN